MGIVGAIVGGCQTPKDGGDLSDSAFESNNPVEFAPPPQPVGAASSMERLDDRRPLAVGDKVRFQIAEENTEPVTLQVASSGELEIPMLGRISAAGRTPKAVAYSIKKELESSLYKKATVILGLDAETNKPIGTFYVTGQVQAQGPQQIPRGETITVAQAILRAGGFADFADKRRVVVVRRTPDGQIARTQVDVKGILEEGHLDKDVVLQPNDYVFVRERMFNF